MCPISPFPDGFRFHLIGEGFIDRRRACFSFRRMTNSGQGGSSGGGSARYERLDDRSAVEEVLRAFQGVPTLKVSGGKAVQMISIPREVFEALEVRNPPHLDNNNRAIPGGC